MPFIDRGPEQKLPDLVSASTVTVDSGALGLLWLTSSLLFCVCCSGCQCLHSELPIVHPVGLAVCILGCLPGACLCALRLWLWHTRGECWLNFYCAHNENSKYFVALMGQPSTVPSIWHLLTHLVPIMNYEVGTTIPHSIVEVPKHTEVK